MMKYKVEKRKKNLRIQWNEILIADATAKE